MGTSRARYVLLLMALVLRAQAGEPDGYLGPRPVRPGAETLAPRDFRQFMQASRAAGASTSTDWTSLLLGSYLTNAQLGQWAADYATRCSSIARKFSIGTSVNGADLFVVEISNNRGQVEAKPNFRYSANMHGNEPSGRFLLPLLAEWLCSNQADARASRIINNMHLFLLPSMNPDGFASNSRANAKNVDLNRNFPSPFTNTQCKGKDPELCPASVLSTTTSSTQKETKAVMTWMLNSSFPFAFAANMHEGAVVANYPWDGYDDGSTSVRNVANVSPDDAAYIFLSKVYSTSHTYMSTSSGFTNGITNGAQWYPIYGSLQDWSYVGAGCFEITLELNSQKRPPSSQFQKIWDENRNAMLNLPIAAVLGGIQGTVTAASGGAALTGAKIVVAGNTMPAYARGLMAYYNKPSAPGTYTLTVTATGYVSQTATVIVPSGGAGVVRNFALVKV